MTTTTTSDDRGNDDDDGIRTAAAGPSGRAGRHGPGAAHPRGGPRRGAQPGQGRRPRPQLPGPRRVAGSSRRRWSGPGPGLAGPADCSASATRDVARSRGWSGRVAEGSVFGRWPAVVGEQIAAHAAPTSLNDGVLTVSAESTAWATQLRMVQAQLLAKIAAAVGDGVVTSLKIVGPVGAVVAQGPLSHRRPRTPRHVRMSAVITRWLRAATTPRSDVLKRLDAPRIREIPQTAQIGV